MDAVAIMQTVQTILSAVQSGSTNLNISEVIAATNATLPSSAEGAPSFSPFQLIHKLLTVSAVRDWLKLLLVGSILEVCRRFLWRSWESIMHYFWITVTLDEGDDAGYWLMFWLSKHRVFRTARTLDVSTRSFGIDSPVVSDTRDMDDISKGRRISFLPSLDTTYALWYKYRYLTVTRSQTTDSPWHKTTNLQIRMLTRNHELLRDLLLEAKKMYYNASENLISIYVSDSSDYWKLMSTQHKRPMKSIILDPGVIELVLNDAKDFLASKEWYAERGIPHRRGYLLYGAPGAGKTSLIHTIAGELNLDVYIISLTRMGMDDASLNATIAELPSQCIVLIEDIDAAFHQGIKRDIVDPERQRPEDQEQDPQKSEKEKTTDSACRVTLSGLLNALDGIGAQEGRIFFATTNDHKALDPALCRPGRLDLHIEFKLASKYQCRELFRRFYLPSSADDDKMDENEEDVDEKDSGYGSRSESVKGDNEPASSSPTSTPSPSRADADSDSLATYTGLTHSARAPKLSRKQAAELADRFAAAISNRAFSMATLQGYLMTYKTRPYDAVDDVPAWIEKKQLENKVGARSDAPAIKSEASPSPAPSAASSAQVEEHETAQEHCSTSNLPAS
ncbi:P-loop containing nucleoside triphosphate hydrolase protein [Dichomitus squalens]|uniref:P-loop containing nucleoside triphosphate hydrolase protein n=1 Tax=Dichomitus squalens TaxID=114155 RepID=A0A4Q9PIJ7_9APHY|nr:P-loop containing nucleoside triphosphate hydrolase protein [Dichomitus squalens]TBU53676.1 P-loop containing nucleoside triphosphate hydrolase protein [Dichomitus squalens]